MRVLVIKGMHREVECAGPLRQPVEAPNETVTALLGRPTRSPLPKAVNVERKAEGGDVSTAVERVCCVTI